MATPKDSRPPRKTVTFVDLGHAQAAPKLDEMLADIYKHLAGPTYVEGGHGPAAVRWRQAVDEATGHLVTERWNGHAWVAGVFDAATGRWR